jgi:type VI protein secretion system component Hcp
MYVSDTAAFMELSEAQKTIDLINGKNSQLDVVMQVKTQRAGEIEGESGRKYADGKPRHDILGYYFSSGAPSDAGTGRIKGRRRYSAVRIVRNSDAATSKLLSAFSTNDQLTVELASFRAGGDMIKEMKPMFLIKLEDARVKTFTIMSSGLLPGSGAVEIIELLFRTITVESAPQTHAGQTGAISTFKDTTE